MQAAPDNANRPSIPSLVGGIFKDAINLISNELTAARLEVYDELEKAKSVVLLISLGAGALMVGSIFLGHMLVHLLQKFTEFELWACYALVGAALVPVGIVILFLAKQRATKTSLVPTDTIEDTQQDVRWITRRVKYDAR
jgi:hypothetical protein